jgi:hypothetical protein
MGAEHPGVPVQLLQAGDGDGEQILDLGGDDGIHG